MDPETIMLGEMTEKDKCCDITYMWNQKKIIEMNAYTKTERDSQIQKTSLQLPEGRGEREGTH